MWGIDPPPNPARKPTQIIEDIEACKAEREELHDQFSVIRERLEKLEAELPVGVHLIEDTVYIVSMTRKHDPWDTSHKIMESHKLYES